MKPKSIIPFILFLLLFYTLDLHPQVDFSVHDTLFNTRKEVYFSFDFNTVGELKILTKIISIDNVRDQKVFAYANQIEFDHFRSLGYRYEILTPPSLLTEPLMKEFSELQLITTWDFYPTYQAYDSLIHQFAVNYPALCRVFSIGVLPSGREIFIVKISDSVDSQENEPRFLYTSTMHGDETTGYVLMLHLVDYLLSNYGTDPKVTTLVNNIEIWINPLANPDGTYAMGNNTVLGATRYNANAVDINRNFPDPQSGPHPDANAWQPETIIFMNLADSLDFVMAANFHGGAELVNYPWDTWAQLPADNIWWIMVSNEYADTAQAYSPSGYLDDLGTGVTNGYAWYEIDGGRQDYMNYFHNCREVTIEISSTKLLPANQLISHWNYNYRSFLNYMHQCLCGLRGIVTDSVTGSPVIAKVFANNHDIDSSHVYSSLPKGNYHRLLSGGTYSLTFSSPGYYSKTFNNVSITNYNTTILDVQLVPQPPVADFYAKDTASCNGLIDFISQTSPTVTNFIWNFGDSTIGYIPNPSHQYQNNGIYTVKLTVINPVGSDSVTKTNYVSINMPQTPVVKDTALCGPGSVILSASGPGKINWYDAISGGNLVDTGNIITIPFLDTTTTFYLQSEVEQPSLYTGKPDNTGGGDYYNSNYIHYLVFDCYKTLNLKSVKVYANGAGNRTIDLRDQGGNVIKSVTVYIPTGQSRINLDFDVPVGNNLQMAGPVYPNLYRNDAGINYPYTIPGLISIKYSSATSNPTGYYYYFYDWEVIPEPCVSPFAHCNVFVNQGLPLADFTYYINSQTVSFTNTSFDGNEYIWYFGDGNTSNLFEPVHHYQFAGIYTISLKVMNACGFDSTAQTIIVSGIEYKQTDDFQIFIYPNPSDGSCYLKTSGTLFHEMKVSLFNILGETVGQKIIPVNTSDEPVLLDYKNVGKGIYLLKIEISADQYYQKLIFR